MARSDSLFTVTSSRSHTRLTGRLSDCQHWCFPLHWAGNGLSARFSWPSYMYMIKWWHSFNRRWAVQLVIDSWRIGHITPLSDLPDSAASRGCSARERLAANWQLPIKQITMGKIQWKPVRLMMVEMLAGWERKKPAAETRGQSGSPRNSRGLLHSIGDHVVENENKNCSSSASPTCFFRSTSKF